MIKSPEPIPQTDKLQIFLAGSIEMGTAVDWQTLVGEILKKEDVVLLNPKREA